MNRIWDKIKLSMAIATKIEKPQKNHDTELNMIIPLGATPQLVQIIVKKWTKSPLSLEKINF